MCVKTHLKGRIEKAHNLYNPDKKTIADLTAIVFFMINIIKDYR